MVCDYGYLCTAVVDSQCPLLIHDRLIGYLVGQQGIHFLVVEVAVLGYIEALGGVIV